MTYVEELAFLSSALGSSLNDIDVGSKSGPMRRSNFLGLRWRFFGFLPKRLAFAQISSGIIEPIGASGSCWLCVDDGEPDGDSGGTDFLSRWLWRVASMNRPTSSCESRATGEEETVSRNSKQARTLVANVSGVMAAKMFLFLLFSSQFSFLLIFFGRALLESHSLSLTEK